jgi:DNA polymerase-4
MGVHKVGTLSQMPVELVVGAFGKNGRDMWNRANAIDTSPVVPYRESISVGTENTFEKDTIDIAFLHRELARMTERTAFELRDTGRLAGCITVKIKYADHQTFTKQSRISYSASDKALIIKARELFDQLYERRQLVRLVGIRLSDLVPGNYQITLFDDTEEMVQLDKAVDSVKKQFGEKFLIRGCGFDPKRQLPTPNKQFRPFKF